MISQMKAVKKLTAAVPGGSEKRPSGRGAAAVFAGQLTDAVTLLLIAAAAVSAIAGAVSDALPIMVMALMNTVVNFAGEYRSELILRRISEISGRDITDAFKETPMSRETDRLSGVMSALSFAGAGVYLAVSLLRGAGLADSFYISASLLIASVPQGIRALCMIANAHALQRCLDAGAAVTCSSALEKLGRVGTLCIGKTGILTEGYLSAAALTVFSGSGFKEYEYSETEGRLTSGSSSDGFRAWEDSALSRTLLCAAVCNNARRVRTGSKPGGRNRGRRTYYEGDPCEAALLKLCSSCGIERELLLCERISEKGFDPEQRYMMVTVREHNGRTVSYAKGAPETMAALCSVSEGAQNGLEMLCEKYGALGMRLLAFGMNSGSGWQLLGLAAFRETLRPQCAQQIRSCRRMGISTLLLTGEHPSTAKALAARAGIIAPDSVILTGEQLDRTSDEELYDSVRGLSLVSRIRPGQRERVVSMLRSRGVLCACASDKPVQQADLRISPEDLTADVILVSGGISALARAAAESRALCRNIRAVVSCMIAWETSVLLIITAAAVMGMPPLLRSCHLLIAAVLCGSWPALMLAVSPACPDDDLISRHDDRLFDGSAVADSVGRGVLTALCTLGCCSLMLTHGYQAAVQSTALLTLTFSHCMVWAGYAPDPGKLRRFRGIIIPGAVIVTLMFLPFSRDIFSLPFPGTRPAAAALLISLSVPAVKKLRYFVVKRLRHNN